MQTLLGGFRPRRFWSSLHAAHAVRHRRLALYWAVTGLVILMTGAGGWYLATGIGMYRDHRRSIDYYQKYPARGGFTAAGLSNAFPLPPDRRFFSRLFNRQYHRGLDAHLSIAAMAWPWLSLAALLIFRTALRRARIRWTHVLRCVVYAGDVFPSVGAVAVVFGWMTGFERAIYGDVDGQIIWARRAVAGLGLLAAVFTYRLGVAYHRYLRLDHPWSTVILSQAIVALFVVTALSLLNDQFFWLIM